MSDRTPGSNLSIALTLLACSGLLIACSAQEAPVRPPPEIKVVEVVQRDTTIRQDFVGQTLGSTDVPIRARVQGVLESRNFFEGGEVEAGQLLYTIEARPFRAKLAEAQGRLAEAQTQVAKSIADLERIEPLAKMHAVSQQDLDAAIAQKDAALGSLKAAQASVELANIELGYASIYSPIAGHIGISEAEVGEFVGASPNPVVLTYVSLNDPIRVQFSISERDFIQISRRLSEERQLESQATEAREQSPPVELFLADGSLHQHKGKIVGSDAAINPETGTFTLEADFPNPGSTIVAGQFARARLAIDLISDALLIPQRALSELQGKFRVFVVNPDGKVVLKPVELGPQVGRMTVVKSGLEVGDAVAIEGLLRLKEGAVVKPVVTEFDNPVEASSDIGS
ncbi:MAG: efflux RND transporter periplasmic adaptor subunit [Halioglobus sp.]